MNRNEVLGVLSILKAAYPNFYRGMSRNDAEDAVNLWCDIFRDDDAGAVGLAVKAFIAEDQKGYPPAPGQLKAKLPKSGLRAIGGPMPAGWGGLLSRYDKLVQRRRDAGIPSNWEEAKAAGLTPKEYVKAADEAGLCVEECLWEIERGIRI